MRTTHTYAELPVSRGAHDEIRRKLEEAGYGHQLEEGRIQLEGIALVVADEPAPAAAAGGAQ